VRYLPWWKKHNLPELVEIPWLYVVLVIPICLMCMSIVGVGANRAGFGYEQQIPVQIVNGQVRIYQNFSRSETWTGQNYQLLEISNYVYHFNAHSCSSFVISSLIVPWTLAVLGLGDKWSWLVLFCIMVILFTRFWEVRENRHMHEVGGPRLGDENPQDDSEWDMAAMLLGVALAFAFWQFCYMICRKG
jgi:hypothetical protein